MKISVDLSKADIRFIYYWFSSRETVEKIINRNSSSGVPHINLTVLRNFEVPVPPLPEQQRIAAILSAYDDLIENNRRRIGLLEEAARQLYKEWFVRFRFPGHEHVKIVDGVPERWERKALSEVAEVVMGQSPKSQYYNDAGSGLPFHQGVTDYGFRFVCHRTYSTVITKLAEPNDILVSVRAPVGRINITPDRIVLGRGLSAIRSKSAQQSFLLYALKEHFYAEDIIGTGAIYAATNKKELESQQILVPTEALIVNFEEASAPIDAQIANLSKSIEHLTKARDLLLPRLMNGTLTV
jgi:type I restriction enzyme, S subunit